MATTTTNLGLFKYTEDDYELNFSFQTALNDNWDKIDEAIEDSGASVIFRDWSVE